jgi:hypothetical protein
LTDGNAYFLRAGLYSKDYIQNLAMCLHLNLLSPSEIRALQSKMSMATIEQHLGELVLANAPAYKARKRQTEKA